MTRVPVTVTPLHKHHGKHGGLIALGLLVTSGAVVWLTEPRGTDERSVATTTPVQSPAASVAPPVDRGPPITSEPVITATPKHTRVTAIGFATFDERRTQHVGAPVHGWLQKTRASSLGRKVKQGEVLGVVYSADVYFATVDLLTEVRDFTNQELLDRQRIRLLRLGMPRSTLARIEKTRQPQAMLPIVARASGMVVAEQALERQFLDPRSGEELFTISDPHRVWVFVEVPDADVPRVNVGAAAKLSIDGLPSALAAKVGYVFRRSDGGTRTVRFDVTSPRPIVANARVSAEIELAR